MARKPALRKSEDDSKGKDKDETDAQPTGPAVADTAGAIQDEADKDPQKTQKADDDDESEDDDEQDEDEDGDDDSDADDDSIGEVRLRILPDGSFRMVLADDDDEDDDLSQPEDEDEDMSDDTQKSLDAAGKQRVSAESLQKALQAMQDFAQASDPAERRADLLRRAKSKQGLSKAESRELFAALGSPKGEGQMAERVSKAMEEDADLHKSALSSAESGDVREYLDAHSASFSKGLSALATEVEASSARQHQANLVNMKALARIGQVVKALGERMDAVASGPARAPKSLQAGAPVQKSFAGAPAQQISQTEALDLLAQMNRSSRNTPSAGLSKSGKSFGVAMDVLETTGEIDAQLLKEVQEFKALQAPGAQAS